MSDEYKLRLSELSEMLDNPHYDRQLYNWVYCVNAEGERFDIVDVYDDANQNITYIEIAKVDDDD